MLISNSPLLWVLLSAWCCSQLSYCLICWVLVMLSTLGYEQNVSISTVKQNNSELQRKNSANLQNISHPRTLLRFSVTIRLLLINESKFN